MADPASFNNRYPVSVFENIIYFYEGKLCLDLKVLGNVYDFPARFLKKGDVRNSTFLRRKKGGERNMKDMKLLRARDALLGLQSLSTRIENRRERIASSTYDRSTRTTREAK